MAEITTTQAFSDGDTVTATKLNNITANAAIQTEAITNRSAETTVDQANDLLLMYDASATALKKVTLSNVIKAGTSSNFPVTGNATIGGTLGVTGVISAASTLELGHASDTTLSRGAAGRLQVEGVDVPTISSTDTLTNKTLTSPAISGGTINNAVIGGTTAAAGSFTTLSATSPITTQAGTAASPAIVPTGDTNTGIFFPAADTIAFSEGGTESMRIDSSGNVGIGATSPQFKLDLNYGDVTGPAMVIRGGRVTNGAPEILFKNGFWNDGNYGAASIVGNDNGSQGGNLIFKTTTSASGPTGSPTERLRIDSSGNVGVGTSAPVVNFDIEKGTTVGANDILGIRPKSGALGRESRILFGATFSSGWNGSDFAVRYSGGIAYGGTGGAAARDLALKFYTADKDSSSDTPTERLRITSGGEVGIGLTNPIARLSLGFNGSSVAGSHFVNTDSGSAGHNYILFYRNTSTLVGSITCTNTATSYNTSSDYRLKTNIEPISNGIDRIKQLPVYRFNWIVDESGNKVDGFVAHEAQAIVPECVTGEKDAVDADGKPIYQGIDQSKIVPLLTAALKEAIAKIETLESKVTALEAA